jgi:hypothetical protein
LHGDLKLIKRERGMEQVLQERELLGTLDVKNGRYADVCGDCKKSQAAPDKAAKEAKVREDEIEGSGVEGFGKRGQSSTVRFCSKEKVLAGQLYVYFLGIQ